MIKQRANVAAIYKRLSRDDGGDAESNSIVTQGQMLRRFAKEHGFIIYDEYTEMKIAYLIQSAGIEYWENRRK